MPGLQGLHTPGAVTVGLQRDGTWTQIIGIKEIIS